MNDDELKEIADKVIDDKASKEETLLFMQEFNRILEELKEELKK